MLLRFLLPGVFAGLLLALPALSHEADCPVCKLKVVQDTDQQDNEVALRYGRKRIEYRCVYCALVDAQKGTYKDDLTILAPSELKGKPIVLRRKDGKWAALPEQAIFLGVKREHTHCATTYRAFSTPAAFTAYLVKHPELPADTKPLSLTQLLALAKTP